MSGQPASRRSERLATHWDSLGIAGSGIEGWRRWRQAASAELASDGE